jgi:PAS domain S-box-containing protein
MAWIGMLDVDRQTVRPVARAGYDDGYLDSLQIRIAPVTAGLGPTGTAIREKRHEINNDFETNASVAPWREAALKRGYRASAAFPILLNNEAIGALSLYAAEPDYFDDELVRLLDSLTANLTFALESIELEERRRASDRELQENEERFRKIFEEGLTGVAILTPELRLLRVNPSLAHVLGYDPAEMADLDLTGLVPAEERSALRRRVGQLFTSSASSYRTEGLFVRRDGRTIWGQLAAAPIRDSDGRANYAVLMFDDITERKHAETVLRESRELYRTLLTKSPGAVLLLDMDARATYVSERLVELFGYAGYRELVGRSAAELIAPDDHAAWDAARAQCLAQGFMPETEYTMQRRDGSRFRGAFTVSLIRDQSGKPLGFLGLCRPVAGGLPRG